ncbi:hypothetical protein FQN57_006679 [Myotisia sp. PD_48]|nr:hypothetical protein FQN57_006679 [Myotisia sp. PD_48]
MATSSTTPSTKQWIVIVPDHPGMLSKRKEVRDTHLSRLGPILDSGFLKMGGAVLDEHPAEGEAPAMNGSALIVCAESAQEIRDTLSKDIYATSGVWNVEKAQITPFRCAISRPL